MQTKHYRSFWPIVIIAVLSSVIGGLIVLAVYNTDLQEQISSMMPGHQKALEGWKTYRNEEYGFEFKYPKSYFVDTSLAIKDFNIDGLEYVVDLRSGSSNVMRVLIRRTVQTSETYLSFIEKLDGPSRRITIDDKPAIEYVTCGRGACQPEVGILENGRLFEFISFRPTEKDKLPQDTDMPLFAIPKTLKFLTKINTSTWQTYRNEEYGFEFQYPPNWEFSVGGLKNTLGEDPKLESDGTWSFNPFVAVGNPLGGKAVYPVYFFVMKNPKKLSVETYVNDLVASAPKEGPGGIRYEKEFSLSINNQPAYELYGEFNYDRSDESVFFTNTDKAYLIQFPVVDEENTNISNSKTNNATAHQILSTFKFIK